MKFDKVPRKICKEIFIVLPIMNLTVSIQAGLENNNNNTKTLVISFFFQSVQTSLSRESISFNK